jgi:Peptidase family M23
LLIARITAALVASISLVRAVCAGELQLPIACSLGRDCFVQQFPDVAPGPDVLDPFCGKATYDGHQGIDFRVLSMADVSRGVPVLAMAEGKVRRVRDGMPDRLITTQQDRDGIAGQECGNGIVIDHGEGIEAQYCHLKQGSVGVVPGQHVGAGDLIGAVGASGLAQFPHVHITIRRNGEIINPLSNRSLARECDRGLSSEGSLFDPSVMALLGRGEPVVMISGLAGGQVSHASLVGHGPPRTVQPGAEALVAWAWLINLNEGDQVTLRLLEGNSQVVAEHTTEPMIRPKADYSLFVGRRVLVVGGSYTVEVEVRRRDGQVIRHLTAHEVR